MAESSKSSLRKLVSDRRARLSPKDHAMLSTACGHALVQAIEVLELTPPPIIAGYSAIRDELDISHALHALSEHYTLALPATAKNVKLLTFRRYHRGDTLTRGTFGVMEPPADAETLLPAIVIVPLLAFDRGLNRLGYGAGYYDATLCKLRSSGHVLAIGAAFAFQEVDAIPAEASDQRLDMVVTEKEVIRAV
jgi:5-formyltetrahydrofolate cyclo-ligase